MSNHLQLANEEWYKTFEGGPYSTLKMIDFLLGKVGATYNDFVESPGTLKSIKKEDFDSETFTGSLRPTWGSLTGRCTSFALKIISQLESIEDSNFVFSIYDLKGHRIARCRNTGIVLDSSSKNGAFQLEESEWKRFEGTDAAWKWSNGTSKFDAGQNQGIKASLEIISSKQAIARCLLEVGARPVVLRLFR
ncbi:hypothetical protein VE03_03580 [Pseudogymnoascus sp. 23342-1-I1]|nr:hypothetical protein VE03_03580 [Pseudogymnoascus sp. 23342-1-I1]